VQATVATPQQLAAALADLTGHINRTATPDMFRLLDELDLSFTQMKLLYLLHEQEETTVKEIAGRLSMSVAAMSRSIDGLVQRGLVARQERADDRRSKRIALLPPGREVLERVAAVRQAALVAFAAGLPDAERTALHAALSHIAERISSR
jgi:DNA-binding MarR family transcriptional regulator